MSYYFALSSGPGSSQDNSGPGPSQGNSGPSTSQGNSSPSTSHGNQNVEDRSSETMSEQNYFETMKKFQNLLKNTEQKGNHCVPTRHNHDVNKSDDSSSEDDCIDDSPFLRDIETCQKMRVKILLELYKNIEEAPLELWHTLKHKKPREGDNTSL